MDLSFEALIDSFVNKYKTPNKARCARMDTTIPNFPTPICDRCDHGAIQDAEHIFTWCPAFSTLRQDVFENFEPDDLTKITDHQLGRFISESNYCWFPQDEEPEDPG